MPDPSDRRLIEEYLPIKAISAEASREKNIRKGHISTLHLWWARRPLVACRAAVYGALVPASRFVPNNGSDAQKKSLGRANAAKFVTDLCKYPGDPRKIKEAQKHILEAHAERLTQEPGQTVTVADILEGRQPRPKVLDMFAGGGAIPLEALRLGCEAYALDLNPVAHIIELCTLVYPQKYGKPDQNARGMTGPPNDTGETTWGGLAKEVKYWGEWVLEKVKAEIGDLYPPIPDPDAPAVRQELGQTQQFLPGADFGRGGQQKLVIEQPAGYLTPVAYLWTRTVRCKNPSCGATVPLVRQTWLCKKAKRYAALKMMAPPGAKQVRFEVVESDTEKGLGFDPTDCSKGGNATCPFCGTVADEDHVRGQGSCRQLGQQLMAVICVRTDAPGKVYVSGNDYDMALYDGRGSSLTERINVACSDGCVDTIHEEINETRPSPNARGLTAVTRYGIRSFRDLYSERQMLLLVTLTKTVRERPWAKVLDAERSLAIATCLALMVDKIADYGNTNCRWISQSQAVADAFARHALPMLWDYAEIAPFGATGSNALSILAAQVEALKSLCVSEATAYVTRGSATSLPPNFADLDAIITDPPYYDNIPYADVSDFFYIWLKRTIGDLHPEHFGSALSPKRLEATALSSKHSGDMGKASAEYERLMLMSFQQASQRLKPSGQLVVVYAHKTTLGWATLVDALRRSGFMVTEAWPLDTERSARLLAIETASLASSIFIVARKRDNGRTGSYEEDVQPDLQQIVRERVDSLWEMGVSGADLVIAAVGAGLRAFTRFARVEYSNGEEMPAERFLAEVEGVVLETILEKIFGMASGGVAGVDGPSRFYVLWRYAYGAAPLDAGEAIVFTYGQPVELDGQNGLSSGSRALVEKKKGSYRLLDYKERGDDDRLGISDNGVPASLIDVLHRVLWLMENNPRALHEFLDGAMPNRERLRLVAQALAGAGLSGKTGEDAERLVSTTSSEHSALGKLLANWRSVIEQNTLFGSVGG